MEVQSGALWAQRMRDARTLYDCYPVISSSRLPRPRSAAPPRYGAEMFVPSRPLSARHAPPTHHFRLSSQAAEPRPASFEAVSVAADNSASLSEMYIQHPQQHLAAAKLYTAEDVEALVNFIIKRAKELLSAQQQQYEMQIHKMRDEQLKDVLSLQTQPPQATGSTQALRGSQFGNCPRAASVHNASRLDQQFEKICKKHAAVIATQNQQLEESAQRCNALLEELSLRSTAASTAASPSPIHPSFPDHQKTRKNDGDPARKLDAMCREIDRRFSKLPPRTPVNAASPLHQSTPVRLEAFADEALSRSSSFVDPLQLPTEARISDLGNVRRVDVAVSTEEKESANSVTQTALPWWLLSTAGEPPTLRSVSPGGRVSPAPVREAFKATPIKSACTSPMPAPLDAPAAWTSRNPKIEVRPYEDNEIDEETQTDDPDMLIQYRSALPVMRDMEAQFDAMMFDRYCQQREREVTASLCLSQSLLSPSFMGSPERNAGTDAAAALPPPVQAMSVPQIMVASEAMKTPPVGSSLAHFSPANRDPETRSVVSTVSATRSMALSAVFSVSSAARKIGNRRIRVASQEVQAELGDETLEQIVAREYRIARMEQGFRRAFAAISSAAKNLELFSQGYRNDLQCRCCFAQLVDPALLWPCGHTFCKRCIESTMKREEFYVCGECGGPSREGHTVNVAVSSLCQRWSFWEHSAQEPSRTVSDLTAILSERSETQGIVVPASPLQDRRNSSSDDIA